MALEVRPPDGGRLGVGAGLGPGALGGHLRLWNWGVGRVPASRAGVFLNLEPLVGALLGVLVLGEAWGPGTVVGGALIIGAAGVVSSRKSA